MISGGKLKSVPLTNRVLQKAQASRQPEDIGTIPTAGFVRTLGCISLIGFAWASASVFSSAISFMWCVLTSCIVGSIALIGAVMLGVMHPAMTIFLPGFSLRTRFTSSSAPLSPLTVQMLRTIVSASCSVSVREEPSENLPLIISPSAMFALHPKLFTWTFMKERSKIRFLNYSEKSRSCQGTQYLAQLVKWSFLLAEFYKYHTHILENLLFFPCF